MSRHLLVLLACALVVSTAPGQDVESRDVESRDVASSAEETAIRKRMELYLDAFNQHDAAAVGTFWSQDGVSLAEDSGERLSGRESLVRHFSTFFQDTPTARLSGEITELKLVRPDVALIDGRTTLFVADTEPVVSVYSALLVKDSDEWLISNSRERDTPPQGSREALRELEWLVGTWQDQSEAAQVSTTFRWSLNKAFLIRSFTVQDPDADSLEGTQVIGWDPLNRQIRTWTFNSDGSFGQGTVSKHDDDWLLKMSQVLSDGKLASATQVITRVDPDTMTVQLIGETVNGEAVPSSAPVTVLRVEETAGSATDEADGERGGQP
jgi:uncharacterized protein (TIGR02246 family)